MRMPDGIGTALSGLEAIYQIWNASQARDRVSGAQTGLTITEQLI